MKHNGSVPKLHYGRLLSVEHARRELVANIPAGTSLETVLNPEYWSHYTKDITPNTIIECMCEDGSWEASLRVMFVSQTEVQTQVRWKATYDKVDVVEESETHFIKWISPANKFGVVRTSDKTVVKDGFYPKKQAQQFLQTLS